ncbi:hypothetical protein D3C77_407210 [compost metagenome]
MISKEKVPPTSIPANNPALSNNQEIPLDKPLPATTPIGPTAINVIGTIINIVTVGTTRSFKDACVTLSIAFSTYDANQIAITIGITDEE